GSPRAAVVSWPKRPRGGRGFGWTASSGSCTSAGVGAPPISTSSPRPRPRRPAGAGSVALDKLHPHLPVPIGACRASVVRDHGEPVARRLGNANRSRDVGLENEQTKGRGELLGT